MLHGIFCIPWKEQLHTERCIPIQERFAPIGFNESRCNEHGVNGVSPWSRFIICFYHDRGNSEAYAHTCVPFSSCARRLCWSTAHGFFVFVPPLSLHFRKEYPSGEMFECTYIAIAFDLLNGLSDIDAVIAAAPRKIVC